MKFEILTDRFERRKERTAYGTIPLRRRADGRDFFLKETAAALAASSDFLRAHLPRTLIDSYCL